MHKFGIIPMALLMSLILGSGLAAFTSNTAFAQNYGYEDDYSYNNSTILIHHTAIVIAHTQPTISHMSVKQVHLKDSLQVQ